MKPGDVIKGYRVLQRMKVSGNSAWSFAEKGGKTYFIKRFMDPAYPIRPDMPAADRQHALGRCNASRTPQRADHRPA